MPENHPKPLIVITGSSGLIGQRLARSLHGEYRLGCLDVKPPPESRGGARHIECDLTQTSSLRAALSQVEREFGQRIASVVHLAAYYDFSGEPSPLYQQLTVEGTRRLLGELQRFEVEQFIFSSTLLVMKSSESGEPLTSRSAVEAEWDYPRSKLETEQVIQHQRRGIPAVILRIAGVYDDDGHSLPIAQQIRRIYEKQLESYFFPGDKTRGQSFVHLDDLVDCFCSAIQRRGQLSDYELLLIGEEDVMSYAELQERIGELIHGSAWPTIRIPKVVAKTGAWVQEQMASSEDEAPFIKPWMIDLADQNYPVSVQQARVRLGWQPRHTLRDTLPEIIARLKADPQRWYQTNGLPLPDQLQEPEHAARA